MTDYEQCTHYLDEWGVKYTVDKGTYTYRVDVGVLGVTYFFYPEEHSSLGGSTQRLCKAHSSPWKQQRPQKRERWEQAGKRGSGGFEFL